MPTATTTIDQTHRLKPAVVIYNGASRLAWQGVRFPGWVIGCNFAYRDWPLTHCWAVDRMTVADIRGHQEYPYSTCEFWTKESTLELPERWQHRPIPGIDSGSAAIAHALELTDNWVIVIGCDGVCGGDTNTAYQYTWHGPNTKRNIHQRHRRTIEELNTRYPGRILLVWPEPQEPLKTIDFEQARDILNKYRNTEDITWPNPQSPLGMSKAQP